MYVGTEREKKGKSLQRQDMYLLVLNKAKHNIIHKSHTLWGKKSKTQKMQKKVLEEKSLYILTETTFSLPHDLPLEYPCLQ